jgi:hypothetical protein
LYHPNETYDEGTKIVDQRVGGGHRIKLVWCSSMRNQLFSMIEKLCLTTMMRTKTCKYGCL